MAPITNNNKKNKLYLKTIKDSARKTVFVISLMLNILC